MSYRYIVSEIKDADNEDSNHEWIEEELPKNGNEESSADATPEEILNEVRDTYNIRSEEELQLNFHRRPTEEETEAAFEEAFTRLQNENANNESGCAHCSTQVRVESVASFQKGQHLAMPGQTCRSYKTNKRKLMYAYMHHAIVKKVNYRAGTRVEMELIHFTKQKNTIQIYKTTDTYDLVNDEIMLVEYKHPRYTKDVIVCRAVSMLPKNAGETCYFKSYNPLTRNCEHFATWCVVGEGESLQICGIRETIGTNLKSIYGVGSCIAQGVMRLLFNSSDEIADAMTTAIQVPEFVIGGAAVIYLIYCVVKTVVYIKDYYKNQMCWSCCKRKLINLWASFGIFGVTSSITFIIFHFALPLMGPYGIPVMILLVLLAGLLQWSVPKIRRALQSPFNVDMEKVMKLSELELGDVVSLRYYGFDHDVIVTEVHEENLCSSIGIIRGIHYGLRNAFGTREIMEEYFNINLNKSNLKRYNCRHFLCYPGEVAVCRAKKRLKETKWSMFSNRSDHFCFWAKIRKRPRGVCVESGNEALKPSKSTHLSSLLIEKVEVHLVEELQVGDVLEHKDIGIISKIRILDERNSRKIEIEQIIKVRCRCWEVRSIRITVDLNKENIYVKKFHPALCYPMETRATRARRWLNKKGKWWTTDGFIEECILLKP